MPRVKAPINSYRAASSEVVTQKTVSKPVSLQLPEAHPQQYELITAFDRDPKLRFLVAACGTKWGKTVGCTIATVRNAWEHKNSLNWWVAPTYRQSKMAYRLVTQLLPKATFVEYKAALRIELLEPDGEP